LGSDPVHPVRRLHQLLSARAYIRAALFSVRMGRAYLDTATHSSLKESLASIEELLEGVVERMDGEIGFMVYGPRAEGSEAARRILREAIFGPG